MIPILLAATFGLTISIFGTPILIKYLTRHRYGQFIREEGPESHQKKLGTPTMGGLVMMLATALGFFLSLVITAVFFKSSWVPSASALLALFLMLGMAGIGLIDDIRKISQKQSEGLKPREKFILQGLVGTIFTGLALLFPNAQGRTPASSAISITRDTAFDFLTFGPIIGILLFILWGNLIITGTSNAVNLTDGLDGLATGVSILVFSGYLMISLWQTQHLCNGVAGESVCYEVRDPQQLAMIAASLIGALVGFLWWNTSPASIFMGDTGALGLGGALAAFAILTRTELLLVLLAGLFVVITVTVIMQLTYFRLTKGNRIFRMTPLQHHFELGGWPEVQVVIRFWIIAGVFVMLGLGVFYGDWLIGHGGIVN
ncbi:phospho-N-acetylmuramoyl-pentapeptide-transferase [Rothia sp. CCM 9419]|uniref:phospho-N-acetylmuramoyl-pentapeptide- transferase n=1 Tax=Rothia sp. CCM 9419 TaxID=3402662 RepID=UPI003AECC2AC